MGSPLTENITLVRAVTKRLPTGAVITSAEGAVELVLDAFYEETKARGTTYYIVGAKPGRLVVEDLDMVLSEGTIIAATIPARIPTARTGESISGWQNR